MLSLSGQNIPMRGKGDSSSLSASTKKRLKNRLRTCDRKIGRLDNILFAYDYDIAGSELFPGLKKYAFQREQWDVKRKDVRNQLKYPK